MNLRALIPILCLFPSFLHGSEKNLAAGARVTASSIRGEMQASHAIDGKVTDASRWLAKEDDQTPWLQLDFSEPVDIALVDLFTGWEEEPPTNEFRISIKRDGAWSEPQEGNISENHDNPRRVILPGKAVSSLKVSFPKGSAGKVREIAVYGAEGAPFGAGLKGNKIVTTAIRRDTHQIALNQIGFETDRLKRFTVPLSADGSKFIVRKAEGSDPLFEGVIQGSIGDFTAFRPEDSAEEYVVVVSGGALRENASDPFLIRKDLWHESYWQAAVDFLIDTRSVTGTHPSAYGGCPWRDGTYYDHIIPSLVLMCQADPERIASMPRQIDWEADKKRVLDPAFPFDPKNPHSEKALPTARRYYTELEAPKADAPDVVKLLHWGVGFYLINPETWDPSGDPAGPKIHFQTVEQIAYVVWAWPFLKEWLPESFYQRARDFCFSHWDDSLGVDQRWNPKFYPDLEATLPSPPQSSAALAFKGRHAPGNSIGANILLHEVAVREGREDADRYLDSAIAQAEWIVKNLDWNEPWTTKGQRMSEHRTIPNLVRLLQRYPEKAPPGLLEKINAWADVAIRRSDNMWDFRKYDDGDNWTVPKLNDVGSCIAFPAIATAASWVVTDPVKRERLRTLAVSHVDYLFGRNPRLAATVHKPLPSFPGIERGWPKGFPEGLCARLELCRGSISSSPGSEMFPFKPEGAYRHAEGWVNYGSAWCFSLAYLRLDERMGGKSNLRTVGPVELPPR